MAIIYTYPEKATPVLADLVLITDSESTNPSNQTKTVTLSSIKDSIGAGVSSLSSANTAIVASSSTGAITITSTAYTGGTNIGHVPSGSGGSSTAFLNGAGDWATPPNTTYTAGNGIELTGTTFAADLLVNGGLQFSGQNNELQINLSASNIAGGLQPANGGTGLNSISSLENANVNYGTNGTGVLPVDHGGTGRNTTTTGDILRGNGASQLIADDKLKYVANVGSLQVRGTSNTAPSLNCTLAIDDAAGGTGKVACVGLTPSGAQGAKGMHIDLGAYNVGMQINRNNSLTGAAIQFQQTVSGNTGVGSITMTNSATAYNTTSDHRLKENIVDMTGAVDRVKQLLPKRFNFKNDTEVTVDGFLAHEAQAVVPESVTGTKDEVDANGDAVYQGIDQAKLVPLLVGAIKELTARIEALEA